MAAGISRDWRKNGPISRAAQAAYLAQQAQATCKNVAPKEDGSRSFCPKHSYRGCPKSQEG